jgi:hypothetical protein
MAARRPGNGAASPPSPGPLTRTERARLPGPPHLAWIHDREELANGGASEWPRGGGGTRRNIAGRERAGDRQSRFPEESATAATERGFTLAWGQADVHRIPGTRPLLPTPGVADTPGGGRREALATTSWCSPTGSRPRRRADPARGADQPGGHAPEPAAMTGRLSRNVRGGQPGNPGGQRGLQQRHRARVRG